MKKTIGFLWILLLTNYVFAETCHTQALSIKDGDTIKAYCQNQEVTIRLAAIDTPEKKQTYGKEAKNYLKTLIDKKNLTIQIVDKDHYGRLVGNIFIDKIYVNAQMVKTGYAWVYSAYKKTAAKGWLNHMLFLQKQAKHSKIGLWSDEKPVAPWIYRKNAKKLSKHNALWHKFMKLFK